MTTFMLGRAARTAAALTSLSVLALGVTACGVDNSARESGGTDSSEGSGSVPTVKADSSLAALVPASLKGGTLNVASEIYPPAVIAGSGGGQPTGWDIATTSAVAARLGLKTKFTIVPFDSIVPGLQAGRYQAAAGEIFITPERTAVVTFVQTHLTTDSLLVKTDSDVKGDAQSDLCGLTLSAQLGSAESQLANQIAKSCNASGKKTAVKTFQEQAAVNLAVNEGRADAAIGSTSQVAYVVDQAKNRFKTVELPWGPKNPVGIALARNADTTQLAKAMQAATDSLIKDGTLQKILDKYNGGLGGIESSKIVPAPAS